MPSGSNAQPTVGLRRSTMVACFAIWAALIGVCVALLIIFHNDRVLGHFFVLIAVLLMFAGLPVFWILAWRGARAGVSAAGVVPGDGDVVTVPLDSFIPGITVPKVTMIQLFERFRSSLSVLGSLCVVTIALIVWLFGDFGEVSGMGLAVGGTAIGLGLSAILVWMALFGPIYLNPFRIEAIIRQHPGSRVWANYATRELREYALAAQRDSSDAPKVKGKGYVSVDPSVVMFWQPDGGELRVALAIARDKIVSATQRDVPYSFDTQPGVVISVKIPSSAQAAISPIPAPKGLEPRGRMAQQLAEALSS